MLRRQLRGGRDRHQRLCHGGTVNGAGAWLGLSREGARAGRQRQGQTIRWTDGDTGGEV